MSVTTSHLQPHPPLPPPHSTCQFRGIGHPFGKTHANFPPQSVICVHCTAVYCNTRKQIFAYEKTKVQISCVVTAQLISAFVFATQIVQLLFYLITKLSSLSPASGRFMQDQVGRLVFSRHGSYNAMKGDISSPPSLGLRGLWLQKTSA